MIFCLWQKLLFFQPCFTRVNNYVVLVIQNSFQGPSAHIQQISYARRGCLKKPDMRYRDGQFNMTGPFPPHLGLSNLHTTSVANGSSMFDVFILSTGTFPVPGRSEYPFAKQSTLFRPESPVIYGLRLFDLPLRPTSYYFRRRDFDGN